MVSHFCLRRGGGYFIVFMASGVLIAGLIVGVIVGGGRRPRGAEGHAGDVHVRRGFP